MGHAIRVRVGGRTVRVDGRDVAQVEGWRRPPDEDDPRWAVAAERYVEANPRGGARRSDAQRLAISRVLAAGPCDTPTLLAAMREHGWVGADDLDNRLRELRGDGARGGGRPGLPLRSSGGRHWLTEPFPVLDDLQRSALGHVKSLTAQQAHPLVGHALHALDGLLPGVGAHTGAQPASAPSQRGQRGPHRGGPSSVEMQHFEQARVERRPVDVAYWSMNSGREKPYRLVPVEYVPAGPAMKVICKEVHGQAVGGERQFALDRIRRVTPVDADPLPAEALTLRREVLHLVVTANLFRIMWDRNQFAIREFDHEELDVEGHHEVRGTFPVVLGWDVMEQMCAWAGSVVVYEPLWLVNAVVSRLHAGITAMQEGTLHLVKPQPDRSFPDLEHALYDVQAPEETAPVGPRKLLPPDG